MEQNKRIIIVTTSVIVVAILAIAGQRFLRKPTPPAPTQTSNTTTEQLQAQADAQNAALLAFPLSATTQTTLSIQARQEFSLALEEAKKWQPDAVLIAAKTEYTGIIAPQNGKNTYIFSSPSTPDYYWTLTVEQQLNTAGEVNYERLIHYKQDYDLPNDIVATPIQYWKIDYVTALQLADQAGGNKIRQTNKVYDVEVRLTARYNRYLAWDITYRNGTTNLFTYSVDASTGEKVTGF